MKGWRNILRWIMAASMLSVYTVLAVLGGSTYQWLTDTKAYNQSLSVLQAKLKECPAPNKRHPSR